MAPASNDTTNLRDVLPDLLKEFPPEIAGELEEALVVATLRMQRGDPPEHRIVERRIGGNGEYIAIRSSDLDLVRTILIAVAAFVTTGALFPLAAGLAVLLWDYRRKQIVLDPEDGLLLLVLKQAPVEGWLLQEVHLALPPALELDAAETDRRLALLQNARDSTGRDVALVKKMQDGRWRTLDL